MKVYGPDKKLFQNACYNFPVQENGSAIAACLTSDRKDWTTPQFLFDALDAEFGFTLDPCSDDTNAKCRLHYTERENGLSQDWSEQRVFINPPYGREIGRWMKKAYQSSKQGALIVCLVPARTDTEWWHAYALRGEIRFFKGRLKFGASRSGAPFPSAVVIFRP